MPWKKMRLRDAEVFARVNASGDLAERDGRVEVRYRKDAPKSYQANPRNLEPVAGAPLLDDAHCVDIAQAPASPAGAPAKSKRATGAGAGRGTSRKAAATHTTGDHPETTHGREVIAYADGACTGNPGPAGLGVVLIDDGVRTERSEYLGQATNNIAELTAVLRVLEAVDDPMRAVIIHTDSQYAIGVLSKNWKAKANQELIAQLRALLAERPNVRFVHVRGHAGVVLNERADALARQGVLDRKTVENVYERHATHERRARG